MLLLTWAFIVFGHLHRRDILALTLTLPLPLPPTLPPTLPLTSIGEKSDTEQQHTTMTFDM